MVLSTLTVSSIWEENAKSKKCKLRISTVLLINWHFGEAIEESIWLFGQKKENIVDLSGSRKKIHPVRTSVKFSISVMKGCPAWRWKRNVCDSIIRKCWNRVQVVLIADWWQILLEVYMEQIRHNKRNWNVLQNKWPPGLWFPGFLLLLSYAIGSVMTPFDQVVISFNWRLRCALRTYNTLYSGMRRNACMRQGFSMKNVYHWKRRSSIFIRPIVTLLQTLVMYQSFLLLHKRRFCSIWHTWNTSSVHSLLL